MAALARSLESRTVTPVEVVYEELQGLYEKSKQSDQVFCLRPEFRNQLVQLAFARKTLFNVVEDPDAAYLFLSLTTTPKDLRGIVRLRQDTFARITNSVGIVEYDPGTAPLAPEKSPKATREQVYRKDCYEIACARFFIGFDMLPSKGVGVEMEVADEFNRLGIIVKDSRIGTSVMEPVTLVQVVVDDLYQERAQLALVFEHMHQYQPGIGFHRGINRLIGIHRENGSMVDLQEEINQKFPQFNPEGRLHAPPVQLAAINPEMQFIELQNLHEALSLVY
ncbi:hypothetical protein C4579_04005 [Candidatus Microgenomates bacterium]|nr:MAG: hypothetical protein C4579_04005 [Candidatus Microgenomates bacterium]